MGDFLIRIMVVLSIILVVATSLTGCSIIEFEEDMVEAINEDGDTKAVVNEFFFGGLQDTIRGEEDGKSVEPDATKEEKSKEEEKIEEFNANEYTMAEGKLEVHFIDVGQGDATLLICDGYSMLIDAGDNDCGTLVQNYIFKQGLGNLTYAIGTHPDADHIGGLDVIITKFDCDYVYLPRCTKDTATARDLNNAITYKGYRAEMPSVGYQFMLGRATVTLLNPDDEYEDINDNSIVLKVEYGNTSFLFMGDAGENVEKRLIAEGYDLKADVIKLGHHGSNTSSCKEFIESVNPSAAVVSCLQGNEYGHPHPSTLNLLREKGISLYRTDEQGSLIAVSDGSSISWNCSPSTTWLTGWDYQ